MRKSIGILACLAVLGGLASYQLWADVETKKPDKPAAEPAKDTAARPATHKVEKRPFKVDVAVKGVVEAGTQTEVVLRPEALAQAGAAMTVVKAVEHGTAVHKGDTLLTLETEKIDQIIKDAETDQRLAELAIKLNEEELPILEKLLPMDLADAERAKKMADEDLRYFLEVDRPFSEKIAEQSVKMMNQYVEYAREELRQLQKMYRAKDLTEETEEIILKRTRNELERWEFMLETARIRRDHTVKVELPRRDVAMNDNATRQTLSLEKTRATLPLAVNQKRLALDKARYERAKAADRLRKLRRDRDRLTVEAPADGIVYYGKCVRGEWTTAGAMAAKLVRGGTLMPEETIFTIVQARPIFVRATVDEKDLHLVRPGLKGKAVPVAFPDSKLPAEVEQVSAIPTTPGHFETRIAVRVGKDEQALMPGMACTVHFVPYRKAEALLAPAASVFTDDLDEDAHHVYLVGKDGKHARRAVQVGKTANGKTEILDGLREGDEILQEKPGEQGGKKE